MPKMTLVLCHRLLPFLTLAMTPLIWGCTSTESLTVISMSEPLTCYEPKLVELPEFPARQVKGDITIIGVPDLPECKRATHVSLAKSERMTFSEILAVGSSEAPSKVAIQRTEEPVYMLFGDGDRPQVDEFSIVLNITNGSDRVFRAEGAHWQVTRDGEEIPNEQFQGTASIIVLPGQTRSFPISGITLNREWQGGVYAFQLYDVAILRDEAGQIVKMDNYEWYYTLAYQNLSAPSAERRTCVIVDDPDSVGRDQYIHEGSVIPSPCT